MFIGVDVGRSSAAAALTGNDGQIICKCSRAVEPDWSAEKLCEEIVLLAQCAAKDGGALLDEIEAVGIGLPGLVDDQAGMVVRTPYMPFSNTPLRKLFQQIWDVPVYLGTNSNCAALGEYHAGAAKGCRSVVMLTVGTGIGGGFVMDGKLYTGMSNSAMEVGHMIVKPYGKACRCGNYGCWEQYGSARALIHLTQSEMRRERGGLLWDLCGGDLNNVSGRTAFAAARMRDPRAEQVVMSYLGGLSIGIINLINILQPEIICLGGGISNEEDDLLYDPLRKLVSAGTYYRKAGVRLERAKLGDDANLIGAAMLCKAS